MHSATAVLGFRRRFSTPAMGRFAAVGGQTGAMVAAARPLPMAEADRRGRALLALSVAMVAWGVSGVVAKSVDMGGMALAAYRTSVGAVVLIAALLATRRRLTWANIRVGAPGGVFLGLDLVLFFSAVKLTTVANATVIGALQPALVILISAPLLNEKVAKGAAKWALVGLAGAVLVVFGAAGLPDWSPAGDALAVLTLVAWTGYFVASRWARGSMGALEYSTVTALVASLGRLADGGHVRPGPVMAHRCVVGLDHRAGRRRRDRWPLPDERLDPAPAAVGVVDDDAQHPGDLHGHRGARVGRGGDCAPGCRHGRRAGGAGLRHPGFVAASRAGGGGRAGGAALTRF